MTRPYRIGDTVRYMVPTVAVGEIVTDPWQDDEGTWFEVKRPDGIAHLVRSDEAQLIQAAT